MTTLDCGHDASNGTAHAPDGTSLCWPCASERERVDLLASKPGDIFLAYQSSDGKKMTTWPGDDLMTVIHVGALHPWSRERHYVTAQDELGRLWSGTAAPGMWACMRLTKQVASTI